MEINDLFIIKDGDLVGITPVVNIPEGICRLDWNSFRECNFVKEINLPATLTEIENSIFDDYHSILQYNVAPENEKYCSIDGCIYSKDKKKFIKYPVGRQEKTFYINDEVEIIEKCAMNQAQGIENVCIGKGVKTIKEYAFGDYGQGSKISKIYIPKNVTEIKSGAFNYYEDYYGFVIGGEKGSYVHKFALKNKIPFVEVNEDNLDWFFSLSYDEHRDLINKQAENETEYSIDFTEKCFVADFNKGTLTISVPKGVKAEEVTVSGLEEKISWEQKKRITKIIISEGITHIAPVAFKDFIYLESVIIGKDVCHIEPDCFYGDYSIDTLIVDEENKHYKSIDNIIYSRDLKTLVKYTPKRDNLYFEIPSHVEIIGKHSFMCTEGLQSIKVGSNVSLIKEEAFCEFYSLIHIYIDGGVFLENSGMFFIEDDLRTCECAAHLIVGGKRGSQAEKLFADTYVKFCHLGDDEIEDFLSTPIEDLPCVEDPYKKRCEFALDGTTFVKYKGHDTDVIIPEGITVIGDSAFIGHTGIKSITIPNSVEVIEKCAFWCLELESIVIPQSVKIIKEKAFLRCEKLKTIKVPKDCILENDWNAHCNAEVIYY